MSSSSKAGFSNLTFADSSNFFRSARTASYIISSIICFRFLRTVGNHDYRLLLRITSALYHRKQMFEVVCLPNFRFRQIEATNELLVSVYWNFQYHGRDCCSKCRNSVLLYPNFLQRCFFITAKEYLLKGHSMQFLCSDFEVSTLRLLRRCQNKFCSLANVLLQISQFIIFSATGFIEPNFKNWKGNIVFLFYLWSVFCWLTLQAKSRSSHQLRNYWRSFTCLWKCPSSWSGNK